ncbi:MAG: signal peptide peptidase SppA [Candidatus Cloacimonetes bacterium HGW-Cloacimonetes-1]|nr:MAG: signal peptide peptidase SppA [Candidatus Cloacimonetes bacterium HGW-Cloacimonetes-1]
MANLADIDAPIATSDNLFAPFVNPALVGTDGANGLGWIHYYDDSEWQKHYWFVANMDGLSYVLENNDGTNYHTFATGSELFPRHIMPNLYFGSSYRWINSKTNEGDWKNGLVYRPHGSTSLAMTLDNAYNQSPGYKFGLGIRPAAFIPGAAAYRSELSIDLPYTKNLIVADANYGDYEMLKPTFGVNTQIFDGVNISGTYNMETETPMLSFSISSGKSVMGTIAKVKDDYKNAYGYVHLTDDTFKPFLGLAPKTWYKMDIKGSLVTYRAPKYTVGPFNLYEGKQKSIESVIAEIKKAQKDPTVHGILFENTSFATSLALQQELISAVKEFKASGKKIAFYYDNMTNGNFIFAASIADKIYLNPQGSLDLRGFAISSPYFKDMLNSLGIEVMNFKSHEYKTAGNNLSESEMTDAERQVYESLLGDIYVEVQKQINAGRADRLTKPIAQLIDEGPYWIAQEALDAGLVDGLIYKDELGKQLKTDFAFSKTTKELPDYIDYTWCYPKEAQVAVIYAQGNIVMGKGTPGQKIAQETTVDMIRAARKNKAYKGIILRVDSGGGSAQASDIIYRELILAKTENKMPVVVSMSGTAASGGYYIACEADKIVAEPTTITGSIGVIGLSFNAERLFQKIKVNWSTVKEGERADFGTMNRAWKDDEKALMSRMIKATYEDFVGKVAMGRNLPIERVHELAQGRVWTGNQAKERGLVDELGGMDEAVRQMQKVAGIKHKIKLVNATKTDSDFSIDINMDKMASVPALNMLVDVTADYAKVYELWKDFDNDSVLMLSPTVFDEIGTR